MLRTPLCDLLGIDVPVIFDANLDFAHCQVEVITDCGRALQVEQFAAAAALIKVFLDR